MSPKSTQTMVMHRRQQEEAANGDALTQEEYSAPGNQDGRVAHQRRSSDTTHDRGGDRGRSHESDSEEEIQNLPDRFDSEGRRLDRRSVSHDRWTSRSGAFRRQSQRPGNFNVQGAWHVGGTNKEAVERLAHGVTNALDGRGSWMQVLGEVLSEGALGATPNSQGQHMRVESGGDEDGDEEKRRRRKRRE
ncbi:hypothetical protein CRV24_009535 [Beauveria bassiana]|nr:hypothetical protein CRV24_009535 [Beauveria bassiana]